MEEMQYYQILEEFEVPKDERPERVKFIPFFEIMKDKEVVKSIQTSNEDDFIEFIS